MICDYIPSMLESYSNIFSCLKIHHAVHPEQPVAPKYSEFFQVSSRRRLRIIHIKPNMVEVQLRRENTSNKKRTERNRKTSSGEYWFTCWNRPIRNDPCNCSFRKSLRGEKGERNRNSRLGNVDIRERCNEKIPKSIDLFVDKVVNNAFYVAFQEYAKYKTDKRLPQVSEEKNVTNISSKMTVSV